VAKEKDKDALVSAAQEVFTRKGFKGSTLEEIAKEAKTDVKSLKGSFPSMEAVLHAVLDRDIEETSELFTKVINVRGKGVI
jgi:AcrR family transcriptional regulator